MSRAPHSYRDDPSVPDFDDSRPLFVFDNACVLCSGGVRFIMRHDRARKIAFTSAQGPLGQALYRHYGLAMDETYLFLTRGHAHTMSTGYFALATELGGWWRLARVGRIVPQVLLDAVYRLVARNRYRWFGKTEACALLTEQQQARLL